MAVKYYPGRARAIMRGEDPKIQVGYTGKKIQHKNGDKWTDDNGKEWEMENGIIKSIPKLQEARIPAWCPKCKRFMNASVDTDFYLKEQMCHVCVTERDTDLMAKGLFESFQKRKILGKKQGFLLEGKIAILEYLEKIEDGVQIVNEDGTIEKWSGDEKKVKEFLENELKEIDDNLGFIDDELEKLDAEKSA